MSISCPLLSARDSPTGTGLSTIIPSPLSLSRGWWLLLTPTGEFLLLLNSDLVVEHADKVAQQTYLGVEGLYSVSAIRLI